MSLKTLVLFCFLIIYLVSETKGVINDELFSGDYEFIDLTHPFDNSTVYWPNAQKFVFTKKQGDFRADGTWYAANDFAAGEHGGTHIDAPYHFAYGGAYVGDIPLEKLIVRLVVVDISKKVGDNANFVLYKQHLDFQLNHNMDKPCILVFKFGWSRYFKDAKKYLGIDEVNDIMTFPGISKEVADHIVATYKNVVGVGVDLASADPGFSGSAGDFAAHKAFALNGLYILENLNLHTTLPSTGCTGLALPMKIAEGTGAPLRFVAICPKTPATPRKGFEIGN